MRNIFAFAALINLCAGVFAQGRSDGQLAARINERSAQHGAFTRVVLFAPSSGPAVRQSLVGAVVHEAEFMAADADALADLLARQPEEVTLGIPTAGGDIELQLVRANIYADDFSMITASTGAPSVHAPGLHYRGIIAGQSSSLVAISIFPDEVMGFVSDAGGNHILGKLEGSTNEHIYYAERDLIDPPALECATPDDGDTYPEGRSDGQGYAKTVNCVDLYWEVNYDVFVGNGGLVNTSNYITGLFNQHATLYANDGISVVLSQLYIWDVASPYTSTSTSGLLTQFKNFRNSFNGDLGNLLGYAGGGGIAAGFAGLCASNLDNSMCYSGIQSGYSAVPTYSWSVMVVTHEQGHLLGSRHTHACVWNGNNTAIDACGPAAGYGYEGTCSGAPIPSTGGTIMSYCHLNAVGINFNNGFGPQPLAVITNNVNAAVCLSACSNPGCGVPSGLGASNITTTSATLTWTAVSGATSYDLDWKLTSSGIWNTVAGIGTTSHVLAGLVANSAYSYRVRAVCTGGPSAFSASGSFTTLCNDADGDGLCDANDPCPALANVVPGDACNDGDSGNTNDTVDADCNCVGTPVLDYIELMKVVASDRNNSDNFGQSVAISGDYAIVGAWAEDEDASGVNTASSAGSAYIFMRSGSCWIQQQKIVAGDRAADALFGYSVAISGDRVIVGAYGESKDASGGNVASNAGAAYIFIRNGTTWTQQQKIVASDRASFDYFGASVAIDGDYIVVGAKWEDENTQGGGTASKAGSAYFFTFNGATWAQQQKIVASDRAADDWFGCSVAINGGYAIVGACFEDQDASGANTAATAGSAYLFVRNGNSWSQQQKIVASDRAAGDQFGLSVSISGQRAVVGAPFNALDALGGNTAFEAGSAYTFLRNGSTWSQQQKIVASDRAISDYFGQSVAISDHVVVVGAYSEDHDASGGNAVQNAGSAYVFKWGGGTWTQQPKLVAIDRGSGDYLGYSVAVNGYHAIAGAMYESEDASGNNTLSGSGSAYFFSALPRVSIAAKVWLEGPYNAGTSLMNDALRALPTFPLNEPYTALGFADPDCLGAEITNAAVLAVTGNNAIVDWIRLELRSPTDPTVLVSARHALLQRDGDIVSASDGISPVTFAVSAGNYYVAVRHRNHLGCMTASAVALGGIPLSLDFRSANTLTHGSNARTSNGAAQLLWSGNAVLDSPAPFTLKYTGTNNDRDAILIAIGGTIATATITGYHITDVNLDGVVKYTGPANDRDPILVNIGGSTPTVTRPEQIP